MAKPTPVKIGDFSIDNHNYVSGGREYDVKDLIEVSKGLPVFDLPLSAIYIGGKPWGLRSIGDFIYHMDRVEKADLNCPILLDTEGWICDGWHRVSKAILKGETTIKAIRLEIMPEPISITQTNED